MSAPTRGMVAGKAIQTQAQSKEFDEGYERVFGSGSKVRGKFRWDPEAQAMVEVGADWTDAERRAATPTEELVYGKLGAATDGQAIDSRRKHREYMKRNGVTLASDYSDEYRAKEKASKQRENAKDLRESVARGVWSTFKP